MFKLLIITFFLATAFTENPNDLLKEIAHRFSKNKSKATSSNVSRDAAAQQLSEYRDGVVIRPILRTSFGTPVDNQRSVMTAGRRGPVLLQDTNFIDLIAHFDRERIPERVVHARGSGAFGYFEVTHDISKYTRAAVFSEVGKKTPVAVRFSTVTRQSGSAETVRDPRGFAMKFKTEEGIWDLVGLNFPIFFIRDAMLFPNFIHSQKKNPVTGLPDYDMMWDFFSLRPESMNVLLRLFGDGGIPDGVRHIHGFGIHTFKFVNKDDQAIYCKFHLRTNQGLKNLTVEKASELAGTDPDYTTRDLYNAIHDGNYPSWKFYIQLMTFEQAETFRWNPFDATKLWPESEYPLIPVGKLVLNRNPSNYFADVEQIAFCPSSLPPGIEPTPDKMLQGRLFSYKDTQRHRLGPNFMQIPVNIPYKFNVTNYQRDGPQAIYNQGSAPNYFPNSFSGPREDPNGRIKPYAVSGDVDRYDTGDDDNFSQATLYWNSLTEGEKTRLVNNLADSLGYSADFIQERQLNNTYQVSQEFGNKLAVALASFKAHR